MTPEEWQRVKEEFAALVELAAAERRTRLDAFVAAEPRLGRELSALLASSDSMGERFEPPRPDGEAATAPLIGRRIGPWRLVREIGRGGMGTVFEATRADGEFTMRAALKLAHLHLLTSDGLRRVRAERQVLAALRHRNIAALLDGGVTEDGVPWFAMEYIDGERIDRHCDAHRLSLALRLQLLRQACAAVQHAHQHLVVHRDLKPGNILVDAEGTVKLLDFGIAKLIADEGATEGTATMSGLVPLTPAYASPEQRRGEPVTTASDVHGLGVVLHELLAGPRPRDAEPVAPSRAVTAAHAAAMGFRSREAAARALRGDLDAIVQVATHADPARRHPSAFELSEDLRRALAGEPVRARPDRFGYRAVRFVRRNRVAVALASLATTALVVGAAVALHLAAVANRERDRAVLEARRTRAVTQFFQDAFAAASPDQLGSNASVVAALDLVIPRIDSSFRTSPDLRAAIKNSLGATLLDMYLPDRARPLAEDALRTIDSLGEAIDPRTRADALYNLAAVENASGDLERAESLYTGSIARYWQVPGIDSAEVWRAVGQRAAVKLGLGRFEEAVADYRAVTEALGRLAPRDSVPRSVALANLATAFSQLGRYAEAEPLYRDAIALLGDPGGVHAHRVAATLQPWAGTLLFLGRTAEAEAAARRSMELNRRRLGPAALPAIEAQRMLVNILADADRCREAIALGDSIVAVRRQLPDGDPSVGTALMFTGWCRARLGEHARGVAEAREALSIRTVQFPTGHWAIAQAQSMLGDAMAQGEAPRDRAEAGRLLRAGYEGLRATLDTNHVRVRQARARLEAFEQGGT